jgi:hypothetical protein
MPEVLFLLTIHEHLPLGLAGEVDHRDGVTRRLLRE